MTDRDFHDRLLSNPEEAIGEYDLSPEEREALLKPSERLYSYIVPRPPGGLPQVPSEPLEPREPPTVIVVVVVVAIVVFVAARGAAGPGIATDMAKYQPLIDRILQSRGRTRSDLVITLVNELTRE